MIFVLCLSVFWQIYNLTKLVDKQIAQVIHISFVKNEQVRTKTFAELK